MDRKDKINTLSTKSMKEKFPYLSNYSEVTTENLLFMGNLQLNEIINVNQNVEKYKKMMNKDLKKIKEMVKSEYDK